MKASRPGPADPAPRWSLSSTLVLLAGVLASEWAGCAPTPQVEPPGGEPLRETAQAVGAGDYTGLYPIGGGEDYGDWVDPQTADYYVETNCELLDALAHTNTPNQTIIYIDDEAVIDLTPAQLVHDCSITAPPPTGPFTVPTGTLMASGRGYKGSLGGLIVMADNALPNDRPLFLVPGTNVRFTGLRIQGPDIFEPPPTGCSGRDAIGIKLTNTSTNVLIDNNELWGWPRAAVWAQGIDSDPAPCGNAVSGGAVIRNNHIHHNRRRNLNPAPNCGVYGYGYGVSADQTNTLIEANVFNDNRHSVASTGRPGTRYEAAYNVVLGGGLDSVFDVHGGNDNGCGTWVAGHYIYIHNNTILDSTQKAVLIRGEPTQLAYVSSNLMTCAPTGPVTPAGAPGCVEQINQSGHFLAEGNQFWAAPSTTGSPILVSLSGRFRKAPSNPPDAQPGDPVPRAFPGSLWAYRGMNPVFGWPVNPYSILGQAIFDFDGDGRADSLLADGTKWYLSSRVKGGYQPWNGSTFLISELGFADFDNDGITDAFSMFTENGTEKWHVSKSAAGTWYSIGQSSYGPSSVGLADFSGNGKADIFRTTGTEWKWSQDGVPVYGSWATLNASQVPLSDLKWGYFVGGDTRADIFWANGTQWQVSSGGTGGWITLKSYTQLPSELRLGDFDGDGVTDVFTVAPSGEWLISYSGPATGFSAIFPEPTRPRCRVSALPT